MGNDELGGHVERMASIRTAKTVQFGKQKEIS
jgi:hypothetical protein